MMASTARSPRRAAAPRKTTTPASPPTPTAAPANGKAPVPRTVRWDALPAWRRDNAYIVRGYRPTSYSYAASARSLGHVHNETVNIYTHLGGAAAAVGLLAALAAATAAATGAAAVRGHALAGADVGAFGCFFGGAAACLGLSAAYHTVSNHSLEVARFGNKLDYLGIVSLIWGSFVPSIYYGFQCDRALMAGYWAMISTIGAGCAVVSLDDRFRTPAWRPFRAAMFVFMGLSAVVPCVHAVRLYGLAATVDMIGLPWLVVEGVLYVAGALLYAARVPERLSPGRFDIWGSSHQIFHVLVLMAAAAHLQGMMNAFEYEKSHDYDLRCLSLRLQ